MVYGGGLENRYPFRGRGFESHSLRHFGARYTYTRDHLQGRILKDYRAILPISTSHKKSILQQSGVGQGRFFSVVGKADTDPLFPDDPGNAANRRISITLMREAPVFAPSFN